jgi:N-acetylglutamate synthase-like GNAT family acetyltransferase
MATGLLRGVEIRAAQLPDAADIARLLPGATARDMAERLERLLAEPRNAVLVAIDYGPVVGLVALQWGGLLQQARPVARLTALSVQEAERRRGIGRMLLKAASQSARMAGCEGLEAPALPDQDAARGFYAALGFAPAGDVFLRPLRKRQDSQG